MTAQAPEDPRVPVIVTWAGAPDPDFYLQWAALAAQAENPFVMPEWHAAWLSAQERAQSVVLAAWRGCELVGVLPLVLRRHRGVRVLEAPGADLADFSGPACTPSDDAAVGRAIVQSLLELHQRWDVFRVDRCIAGSAWEEAVCAAASGRRLVVRRWRGPTILVDVPLHPGQSPLRRGRDRRELDRLGRRLREQHGAHLRMSDPGTVRDDVETLLALRQTRQPRGTSWSQDRFLLDVSLRASQAGWLRLWVLQVREEMIAGLLGWSLNGRTFAYIMAFDSKYAQLGPGTTLLARAVQQAVEHGDHTFDFLRGDESHKRPYVTKQREARSYLIARNRSLAGLGVRSADLAQTAYRYLPLGLRSPITAVGRRALATPLNPGPGRH